MKAQLKHCVTESFSVTIDRTVFDVVSANWKRPAPVPAAPVPAVPVPAVPVPVAPVPRVVTFPLIVTLPEGTVYVVDDPVKDPLGLGHKLETEQDFVVDPTTNIVLCKGTHLLTRGPTTAHVVLEEDTTCVVSQ